MAVEPCKLLPLYTTGQETKHAYAVKAHALAQRHSWAVNKQYGCLDVGLLDPSTAWSLGGFL
jgi:hypothetical protein